MTPPPTARRGRARRSLSGDEASVSDVLGSILLVGITVVMAAAFGAVLLAYDGPTDRQHTQLAATVGPGADGDWGTNDAELQLQHLGGEPLRDGQLTVRYTDQDGEHSQSAAFTGGRFQLGDTWTRTISATPGVEVAVTVIVRESSGARVISAGAIEAGGTGAVLTYVATITPAAGKGTLQDGPAAGAANDNLAAILREGSQGGSLSTTTRAPQAATNNGASNNNVLLSDDVRSTLDNSGEWVAGSSFTQPSPAFQVSALSIGMEARGVQAVSTVAHVATVTGAATTGNSVSTVAILGAAGEVYVAAVANGMSNPRTVSGISGPPGITWTPAAQTGVNSAGNGRLEVWVGTGTPSVAGIVTASFSGGIDRAAIAVSRYSGVDTVNPVQATLVGEANGNGGQTSVSLGTVAGTAATGVFYAALNGITASGSTGCTFTNPANERADVDPGNSNRVQLCAAGGAAAASNSLAATLSSSADWQAALLTLRPSASPLPQVQLNYALSGVVGPTSLSPILTASDATYEASIIDDRAWTPANITNLAVSVTYPTDTGSDVQVDRVYLVVTVTTSATTFTLEVDVAFAGVPNVPTQVVQLRAKASGDTFRVYAMAGATERQCATIASATYQVATCTLQGSEYNSGSPVVRIRDATPAGTAQGRIDLDYARVSSS